MSRGGNPDSEAKRGDLGARGVLTGQIVTGGEPTVLLADEVVAGVLLEALARAAQVDPRADGHRRARKRQSGVTEREQGIQHERPACGVARQSNACGLGKNITPRAMRRTFQDLTRAAGIDGVVAMAISNHKTDAMRVLYSTAATPEVARAIGKVVSIATAKPRAGKAKRKAG